MYMNGKLLGCCYKYV